MDSSTIHAITVGLTMESLLDRGEVNFVIFPIGIARPMSLAIVTSRAVSPAKFKMLPSAKHKISIS